MSVNTDFPASNAEIRKRVGQLGKNQSALMQGFQALHQGALKEGTLDLKTKELIALAVAVAGRCDDCIGMHVEASLKAGATRDEIEEMLGVCIMMGGGPSLMYATHVLGAIEQFSS